MGTKSRQGTSPPPPSPETIVAWRKRHGVSRRGLGALVGLKELAVWRWETGALEISEGHSRRLHELLTGPPPAGTERGEDPPPVRGDALLAWRKQYGVARGRFAQLVGAARSAVQLWELGGVQPVPSTARKLAAVLEGPPPGWRQPPPQRPPEPPVPPIDPAALRAWRERYEVSLREVAMLVGVTEGAMSRWERGLVKGLAAHRRRLHEILAAPPPVGGAPTAPPAPRERKNPQPRTQAVPPPRRLPPEPPPRADVLEATVAIVNAFVAARPEVDLVGLVRAVRLALET